MLPGHSVKDVTRAEVWREDSVDQGDVIGVIARHPSTVTSICPEIDHGLRYERSARADVLLYAVGTTRRARPHPPYLIGAFC